MGKGKGFPRTVRLLSAGDYRNVFNRCRCKSSDRWLTVLAVDNDLGHPRLGLAISRKAEKSAVERNRVKRIIRDCFRQQQDALGSWDLVVIARAGIASRSNPDLRAALAKHWTRLHRSCADC